MRKVRRCHLLRDVNRMAGIMAAIMLRSKGLKDATCVGWFGND